MRYVVFDLDGVLVDAVYGFTTKLTSMFGGVPHSTGAQQSIDNDPDYIKGDFGLPGQEWTGEQVDAMWKEVHSQPEFWEQLPALVTRAEIGDVWSLVHNGYKVMYVTARKAYSRVPTINWIANSGLPIGDIVPIPSVFLTKDKAGYLTSLAAKHVEVVAVIDDRPHQLFSLQAAGHPAVVMDQQYNRSVEGLPRVSSVSEFVSRVLAGESFA